MLPVLWLCCSRTSRACTMLRSCTSTGKGGSIDRTIDQVCQVCAAVCPSTQNHRGWTAYDHLSHNNLLHTFGRLNSKQVTGAGIGAVSGYVCLCMDEMGRGRGLVRALCAGWHSCTHQKCVCVCVHPPTDRLTPTPPPKKTQTQQKQQDGEYLLEQRGVAGEPRQARAAGPPHHRRQRGACCIDIDMCVYVCVYMCVGGYVCVCICIYLAMYICVCI